MKRAHWMVAAALSISSIGCKKKVDSEDFANRIKQRTTDIGLIDANVTCPKDVEAKQGASFECTVTIGGKSFVLVSTITKVDGKELGMDTKWKDGNAVVMSKLVPALNKELSGQFDTEVTVFCGTDALLFLDKDRNLACQLASGDVSSKMLVTFDDKLVPTTWKLDPQLIGKTKLESILLPTVQEKAGATAKVTCGDKPLLLRPADGAVMCEVDSGGKKQPIKVAVDEDLKVTRWEPVAP